MAHENAKLLLEHAGTFLERTEAVKTAMGMGMPLAEIEEYLDWLDATRTSMARPEGSRSKDKAADPARQVPHPLSRSLLTAPRSPLPQGEG